MIFEYWGCLWADGASTNLSTIYCLIWTILTSQSGFVPITRQVAWLAFNLVKEWFQLRAFTHITLFCSNSNLTTITRLTYLILFIKICSLRASWTYSSIRHWCLLGAFWTSWIFCIINWTRWTILTYSWCQIKYLIFLTSYTFLTIEFWFFTWTFTLLLILIKDFTSWAFFAIFDTIIKIWILRACWTLRILKYRGFRRTWLTFIYRLIKELKVRAPMHLL